MVHSYRNIALTFSNSLKYNNIFSEKVNPVFFLKVFQGSVTERLFFFLFFFRAVNINTSIFTLEEMSNLGSHCQHLLNGELEFTGISVDSVISH